MTKNKTFLVDAGVSVIGGGRLNARDAAEFGVGSYTEDQFQKFNIKKGSNVDDYLPNGDKGDFEITSVTKTGYTAKHVDTGKRYEKQFMPID